jgi:hypothetical protein
MGFNSGLKGLKALFVEGMIAVVGYSSICFHIFHLNSEKLRHVTLLAWFFFCTGMCPVPVPEAPVYLNYLIGLPAVGDFSEF